MGEGLLTSSGPIEHAGETAYFAGGGPLEPQPPLGTTSKHRRPSGPPWLLLAAATVVVLLISGLVWSRLDSGEEKQQAAAPSPSPSAVAVPKETQPTDPNDPFYLIPGSSAAQQVATWKAEGRTADAAQVEKIASQPVASWFAYDGAEVGGKMADLVTSATAAGRIPVMVAYFLPHRDCGQYSSGGAKDAASYRAWIAKLAAATKGKQGYLILEPDALAHTFDDCLNEAQKTERLALIREAITKLKAGSANLKIYIDAGNSAWVAADKMASALQSAGVSSADGFALNVSNFQTTANSTSYGQQISDALGGAHYVIDTSRNGNGPYPDQTDEYHWCNPPGRALGATPTTKTGNSRVDAYLWVKRPGDSDGQCRDGAPAAGQWWADYALSLAKASK